MVSTVEADKFGLLAAASARRKHLPLRFFAALMVSAGMHVTFGWWLAWVWLGSYIAIQLTELALNDHLLKKPPQTPSLAILTAITLYVPSALVFALLGPILWANGGHYGPALGLALMASSLTNLIAVSRSRLAFVVAAAPYALFLVLMPLLDWGKTTGVETGTMVFAVVVILFNVIGAWSTTQEARRAEQEAIREFDQRRREAEAAVEAKSAFVAMICHELRTPISAIAAGASELERTGSGARKTQAQLISHAGQMMRTLLDDLLDLSKLEAGRMTVERLPMDLRRTLAEVMHMWKPQAQAKGVRLRLEGAAQLPQWVTGDPTRLRQVLNNLLSNAIKFTEEGSVTLRVTAEPLGDGRRKVSMAVADTGPGMTPDQIERLFTPFDQLDAGTARKHGGSGLGLAISKELARLMGGELTAQSQAGKGATFTIALTLEEAEAPAAEQAPTAVEARVLVVDDHAVNRQAIAMVLAPLGITPELSTSAEEGLERLAHEPFDLVLMDVYMPGMCGREATRVLRSQPGPNRETPVVAITASATPKDWDACLAAGMNGYVGKPIDPAQLYGVVEAVMSGRPLRAEAA
ncbi:MAG TPA: ATP-binding protein [Caulobacteraceae bacterium]|nr:ATP-binding protein [Caulobacteraceae bacterium]